MWRRLGPTWAVGKIRALGSISRKLCPVASPSLRLCCRLGWPNRAYSTHKPNFVTFWRCFAPVTLRSEEHTSELQSLMRISYAVFCLKKKTKKKLDTRQHTMTHISNIVIDNYNTA